MPISISKSLPPNGRGLFAFTSKDSMFSKAKAADYFVVGWVKDWSLRTYLSVIADGERIEWDRAHELFPWLPHDITPFARNVSVRRWASDAMRSINDRLWDSTDNAEKLKLARHIEVKNCAGAKIAANEARSALAKSRKALAASTAMNNISIDTMRKKNGWSTCK